MERVLNFEMTVKWLEVAVSFADQSKYCNKTVYVACAAVLVAVEFLDDNTGSSKSRWLIHFLFKSVSQ